MPRRYTRKEKGKQRVYQDGLTEISSATRLRSIAISEGLVPIRSKQKGSQLASQYRSLIRRNRKDGGETAKRRFLRTEEARVKRLSKNQRFGTFPKDPGYPAPRRPKPLPALPKPKRRAPRRPPSYPAPRRPRKPLPELPNPGYQAPRAPKITPFTQARRKTGGRRSQPKTIRLGRKGSATRLRNIAKSKGFRSSKPALDRVVKMKVSPSKKEEIWRKGITKAKRDPKKVKTILPRHICL